MAATGRSCGIPGQMEAAKCGSLARMWGYDGILVGNAADYRHNNPKTLKLVQQPRSERDLPAIAEMAAEAERIVFAYGRLPRGLEHLAHEMEAAVAVLGVSVVEKCFALKVLADGCPGHPLFVSKSIELTSFVPSRFGKRDPAI